MIEYKFNHELQILEVSYQGFISSEDILTFYYYVSNNAEFPRNLKILTDARKATYDFNINKATRLISSLKESLKSYESVMYAFIHSKPKETAYSKFLEIEKAHKKYLHKIFATKENALEWLKKDLF